MTSVSVYKCYILPARDCPLCSPKSEILWGNLLAISDKSFDDHACLVKTAGYWHRSFFFRVLMDLDLVSVHKKMQKKIIRIGENAVLFDNQILVCLLSLSTERLFAP